MADPILTDVKSCQFKTLSLMAQLIDWTDELKQRLAVHQFLKVDGARVEPMGAEPVRIRMTLVYMGANWRKDYQNLRASIRDNPKGLLVHPLLGQVQVACEGIAGARVVPGEAKDLVTVPISFIEDGINTKVTATEQSQQGVAAKQQQVTVNNQLFSSLAAKFSAASTLAATAALPIASTSYAAAAATSALGQVPDPTLGAKLDAVETATSTAVAAMRIDPAATYDAITYPAVNAAEQVYAACLDVADAVAIQRPSLITFTVPALTSLGALAASLYGTDGASRMSEILALNPGKILNPAAIAGGTQLQLYAATV